MIIQKSLKGFDNSSTLFYQEVTGSVGVLGLEALKTSI
jgi:hypothetical protein